MSDPENAKKRYDGSICAENTISDLYNYDVISVGCGLTTNEDTQKFLISFLKQIKDRQKLIVDADGLNILALHRNELSLKNAIITPHPKELSRLLNISLAEVNDNREKYARID